MVAGSGLRVEAVVSVKTASELFSLIPQYGTRIADFCMDKNLLVTSNKEWPEYVNFALITFDRHSNTVEAAY